MSVLMVVEHDNSTLYPDAFALLAAARRLSAQIDVLVIGDSCQEAAMQSAMLEGVRKVRRVDAPWYADFNAENLALVTAQLASAYDYVVFSATAFGKGLSPRVAAMLDVEQVSDVVSIIDEHTFVRPIYAGRLLQTVRSSARVCVLTIRTSAFTAGGKSAQPVPVVDFPAGPDLGVTRLLRKIRDDVKSCLMLSQARVVVGGGRGVGSPEAFKALIEPLAASMGAAVGATRAAVDCGYIGNECQVGQTGKVIAPDIYVAIGISGAAQHVAGIREAGLIVAINKDPEAPIMQLADVSLVGDLHQIVPELTKLMLR